MTLLAAWHDLPDAERRAGCRTMQALARVFCGPAGGELVELLRQAEDAVALAACDAALAALGTLAQRRILATFAATLPPYDPKLGAERSYLEACRACGTADAEPLHRARRRPPVPIRQPIRWRKCRESRETAPAKAEACGLADPVSDR